MEHSPWKSRVINSGKDKNKETIYRLTRVHLNVNHIQFQYFVEMNNHRFHYVLGKHENKISH